MVDYNVIKNIIIEIAKNHGVERNNLLDSWNEETENFEWKMDYESDIDLSLKRDFLRFSEYLKIYENAKNNGDSLAMRAALNYIRVHAMNISSGFGAMAEDLDRVIVMERDAEGSLNFPENYKIPDGYKKSE